MVRNLPAMQDTQADPWIRKIPWRREWKPTPVSLPGESHGLKGMAGCSPWGRMQEEIMEAYKMGNQANWWYDSVQVQRAENLGRGKL